MKKLFLITLALTLLGCFACTKAPDPEPTPGPTEAPTAAPTARPTAEPTPAPTEAPLSPELMALYDTPMSADEALAAAKELGAVVNENGRITSGKKVWNEFFAKTEAGESAAVLIANYSTLDPERTDPETYEEEKDNYPVLYLSLVTYNGDIFEKTDRDCRTGEVDSSEKWLYLKHFTGSTQTETCTYDHYVLVNEPDVTWEQLEHGMLSANFTDYIPFTWAYMDFFDND